MINKAIIVGNLGADPELRYTQSGTAVASFRVATTERWKGQDGQMQESTEWHSCNAWGKLAEICGKYLQKGSLVYISGRMQTRKWEDKDGGTRYTTEIVVRDMKMLGGRSEGGQSSQTGGGYGGAPPMGDDVPF